MSIFIAGLFFIFIGLLMAIGFRWAWSRLFLEFRNAWVGDPVEVKVVEAKISKGTTFSWLRLQFEAQIEGETIRSSIIGPTVNDCFPFRLGEEQFLEAYSEGTEHPGYFDKARSILSVESRRYDLIDKVCSVFFLLMVPVMIGFGVCITAMGIVLLYLELL